MPKIVMALFLAGGEPVLFLLQEVSDSLERVVELEIASFELFEECLGLQVDVVFSKHIR
jgi:hypothetical protein